MNALTKYKLEIVVFISGALVMILEILGSRILAPYIGTSVFVWTSLIGVVLASLALGYRIGGKLADKSVSFDYLAKILLYAQIALILTSLFQAGLMRFLTLTWPNLDIRLVATLAGTILFAPASVLFGIVSPYCVKLKLNSLADSGSTVGNLYALSTLGSITGTFLTGFVLFSYFKTTQILFFLILALGVLSIFVSTKGKIFFVKLGLIILSLVLFFSNELDLRLFEKNGFIDTDTAYNRIWIFDTKEEDGRVRRNMLIDKSSSSAMYLDNGESPFSYVKYFGASDYYVKDPKKTLMIGGAAFTFPTNYLKEHPETSMDVVEIDSGQTDLAEKYFFLDRTNPRLAIYHEDGRTFVNKSKNKYDVIFLDAFNTLYAVPFHLVSQEFVTGISNMVEKDGIVVLNVISAVKGDKSLLFKSVYKTYGQKFKFIDVYATNFQSPETVQNVVLIVSNEQNIDRENLTDSAVFKDKIDGNYLKSISNEGIVLTDEYAPVESMAFEMIKN